MDAPTTYIVNTLAQHFGFDSKEALHRVAEAMAPKTETKTETKTKIVEPAPAPAPAQEIKKPVVEKKKTAEEKKAERKAKKAAEKAEREAKKAAEKAEREAKKAAEKAEREAKKAAAKPAPLAKPAFPLPWCNQVLPDRCAAITKTYGLYTQCMSAPRKDSKFCAKCAKAPAENSPAFALAVDRLDKPNWQAPDGSTPKRYIQVWNSKKELMKAGVTRTQVEEEAAKFGLKVPASEWTKPERRSRSRKLKSPIAESSDSESDNAASAPSSPKTPKRKPTKAASTNAPKRPTQKNVTITPAPEAEPAAAAAPAPESEPETVDLVARSLAQELVENPYDAETDYEEDEHDNDELQLALFPQSVDLGDGAMIECLADVDNNIYNQDQELIGMLQCGEFVPMETMNRTHSGSKPTVAAATH